MQLRFEWNSTEKKTSYRQITNKKNSELAPTQWAEAKNSLQEYFFFNSRGRLAVTGVGGS